MWWRKNPQPEFWDRCDEASRITRWDDRMDAYIVLMMEDANEYVAWSRAHYRKAMSQ